MVILHIDNTVRDYDSWKAAFDKYDRFRTDRGVRSCVVSRRVDQPDRVSVDLGFDDLATAQEFRTALQKIWQTQRSRDELVEHSEPSLLEVMENKVLSPDPAVAG